jgi:hypothetical protein
MVARALGWTETTERGLTGWRSPQGQWVASCPQYAKDANLALPLPYESWLTTEESSDGCIKAQVTLSLRDFPWFTGRSIAEARAGAWLAWKREAAV